MQLSVNTGAVDITLVDESKREIGSFWIYPSDVGIIERYDNVAKALSEMDLHEDIPDEQKADELVRVNAEMKKQFDYLLGVGAADSIFKVVSPLNVNSDGEFFFETVLEGIADAAEKIVGERVQKRMERVAKATEKYRK